MKSVINSHIIGFVFVQFTVWHACWTPELPSSRTTQSLDIAAHVIPDPVLTVSIRNLHDDQFPSEKVSYDLGRETDGMEK